MMSGLTHNTSELSLIEVGKTFHLNNSHFHFALRQGVFQLLAVSIWQGDTHNMFQYDKVIPIKQTNKYLGTCKGLATHQRRVAKYNFNSQLVHQSQSVSDLAIHESQ